MNRYIHDRPGAPATLAITSLALLAVVTGFLGGSSRADAIQIVALRPLAALFLIPALYFMSRERFELDRTALRLFALLAFWMAIQLVPLPPFLWQSLPGRLPLEQLDAAIGLDGVWRPISLVPSRGWNALASLIVPGAALLLAISFGASARLLLLCIVGLGVIDAGLGLLQTLDGANSRLYFYAITNKGAAVGIFANQNHSGVFSSLVLVTIAHLATDREFGLRGQGWTAGLAAAFVIVLLAALVGGSRAGLLTAVLALTASAVLLWQQLRRNRVRRRVLKSTALAPRVNPMWLLAAAVVAVGGMVAAFVLLDRSPAFEAIAARSQFEDLRWEILPTLRTMMAQFWLVGSGFGSFEEVYHIFEPDHLLYPQYINQAHNDWAQLVIEGGLPAILIAACFLAGFGRGLLGMARESEAGRERSVFWLAAAAIVLSASLVDYPMRTPIFQLTIAWLAVAFVRQWKTPPDVSHERAKRPGLREKALETRGAALRAVASEREG